MPVTITATAPYDDETVSVTFDRTIDAVDDLGWDPEGNEAITLDMPANGTLIDVPPGEYLWDGDGASGGAQRVGLRGTGESRDDVVINTADGVPAGRLFNIYGDGFVFQDVVLDWEDRRDTGGPALRFAGGDGIIRRVERVGTIPPSDPDDAHSPIPDDAERDHDEFLCQVVTRNPDDTIIVDALDSLGSSYIDGHKGGQGIGIVSASNAGTVVFQNCRWENINGDAPVYSSGHGVVSFRDSWIENAAMACLRIGGKSQISGCVLVQDHDNADFYGAYNAANGIFLASQSGEYQTGALVENCDIIMRSLDVVGRPIRHHITTGDVTFRDVRIQVDAAEVDAATAEAAYGDYSRPDDPSITFEDVSITGEGSLDYVFGMENRAGSAVTDSCISIEHGRLALDAQNLDVSGLTSDACTSPVLADGGSLDGSDSTDSTTDSDTSDTMPHELRITGPGTGTGEHTYKAVVNGRFTGGDYESEAGGVTDNGDGTQTLAEDENGEHISVWGGGTDSHTFEGTLVSFAFEDPDTEATVTLDGTPLTTPYENDESDSSDDSSDGTDDDSEDDNDDTSGSDGTDDGSDDSTDDGRAGVGESGPSLDEHERLVGRVDALESQAHDPAEKADADSVDKLASRVDSVEQAQRESGASGPTAEEFADLKARVDEREQKAASFREKLRSLFPFLSSGDDN